jgi:hypothetical protein
MQAIGISVRVNVVDLQLEGDPERLYTGDLKCARQHYQTFSNRFSGVYFWVQRE